MKEILFLSPVFKEMIWGGKKLKTNFGYDIPSDKTGECWAISAHENGDCTIKSGRFAGKTLSKLWKTQPFLFGNKTKDRFPLLIKIIDAAADLSIQVHPDDAFAAEKENGAKGKTECWYILDCDKDATIIVGHNAKSKEEFAQMVRKGDWKGLLREIPIQKGDFFQIEAGVLHAIKGGTVILETQQNSDITYRVYDYDRTDADGNKRPLHTEKALQVVRAPFVDTVTQREAVAEDGFCRETLVCCPFYTVEKWDITKKALLRQSAPFMNVSVIEGKGEIDGTPISKGDHFILPYQYETAEILGEMSLIISYIL